MTSSPAAGEGRARDETPSQAGHVQFAVDAVRPTGRLSETTMGELRELAGRYPQARSALLPMLHLVQSSEGFVTAAGIEACAEILGQTAAEVSAVATFYTMYKRRPIGDYHVGVCTNTLCAVMGGDVIFERLKSHLGVGNDETTPDGKITLEHIECNAACDYAPVVMVNWEFFDNQTPQSATDLVDDLTSGREVTATRGARVCTWRQAERVLAGYLDDRADEGPVGGPATLVGLELARQHNWTAAASGGDQQGAESEAANSGAPAGQGGPTAAVSTADTQRAGSETVADEDTSAGQDGPTGSDPTDSRGE